MRKATLGEQESALLKWVAEHAPASVAEVTDGFGSAQDLARTTVLTVMERLRRKGYLKREKAGGVFKYSPSQPHDLQLRQLVSRFVEKTLGGSVDPFVAYLADEARLSDDELSRLKAIVQDLEAKPDASRSKGESDRT
jgi:predicted transcriptional regulator